jgi:hypothetical protein
MKRLLAEPLLHFLALGGALFLAFGVLAGRDGAPRGDAIVVPAGKVEQMSAIFARTWQRPPTAAELDGLIDDWVREEAAVREALRLGLDRDDTVIRRRLRQKFEFMVEDVAAIVEPTEADLSAYLEANADDLRVDARLSFRQILLSEADGAEGEALLALLRDDLAADASALGAPTMLEHAHAAVTERDIAAVFGPRFAGAVADLTPGVWAGPIESGYGQHLVIVDRRDGGRVPGLDEVRERVRRDWEAARREAALEALYEELVGRYEVIIERPGAAS